MKKYLLFSIAAIVLMAGTLSSCQLAKDAQEESESKGTIAQIVVSTVMPDGFKEGVTYAGKTVTMKSERLSYTATTDNEGKAIFKNVVPDIYSIATSWKLTPSEYASLSTSDEIENRNVLISSSVASQQLFDEQTVSMTLNKAVEQTLLISKIYASGTKDNNNKTYIADKYLEIFNNSDSVQYVDGLYFAFTENESSIAYPASTNKGYIYVRQVYQFPGIGKDYPVQPGKSIVICNSAINHTEKAPTSCDLSTADFEAKSTTYANNADIQAIKVTYTSLPTLQWMNLVGGGDNGVILFQTSADVVNDYPNFYVPGKTKGQMYKRIPDSVVLDGVETLKNKTTGVDINAKRLPTFIDSSYGFINALSGGTHESIERRVDTSRSTSERVYLIDTNNTLNDFKTVTDVTPRDYSKSLLIEN